MDVSVVIVNWNTCDILRDCLASIYENTRNLEFEVIVADNASTDGSVDMVKSEFPHVKIIANAENCGFAAANNQGIAVAKGRYVLLLNSDTIVLDSAIAKTVSFADAHLDAAVVGCRVLNRDRTLQLTCFMFPSILNMFLSSTYSYKIFSHSKFFGRERMMWWQRNDVREVEVITGCFMLVQRKAIDEVGVMDERFFMYGEETDWCYRFKQAGWRLLFTPDAEIIHFGAASSKQIKPQMILQLWGSILLFFKKHKNPLVYAMACSLVAMFFILRIPYWLIQALCSRNERHDHLRTVRTYLFGTFFALGGGRGLCARK